MTVEEFEFYFEILVGLFLANGVLLYIGFRYLERKILWRLDRLLRHHNLLEEEEQVVYRAKDKAL